MATSVDDVLGKAVSAHKGAHPTWRKSSWSIANGQCIEVANLADGQLAVRDSVDKNGPIAEFADSEWRTFLKKIKDGGFGTM